MAAFLPAILSALKAAGSSAGIGKALAALPEGAGMASKVGAGLATVGEVADAPANLANAGISGGLDKMGKWGDVARTAMSTYDKLGGDGGIPEIPPTGPAPQGYDRYGSRGLSQEYLRRYYGR
jgi:hypothetical protein